MVVWFERASSPSATGGLLGQPEVVGIPRAKLQPARRPDQCGGVETGQYVAPGGVSGIEVTIGQPADEAAIRRRRRQPLPVVAGEYLLQQDRHRPAVDDDVVIGQHDPVPIWCGADQRRADGWWVGEVADRRTFGGTQLLDLLLGVQLCHIATALWDRPG